MSSPSGKSAWFVGDGSLLVQAAETWMANGHRVAGVVTRTGSIEKWAAGRGVQCVPPAAMVDVLSA